MRPTDLMKTTFHLPVPSLIKTFPVALGGLALGALVLLTGCSKESKAAKHTTRADAFYVAGDYDKARLEYLNVVQLDPRNGHAIGQLGNIFFENGVVLQAGAAFEQALKLGATDPRIRARLGTLLAAGKRIDQAREHARKALETDPTLEDAVLLLADLANDEASVAEFKALVGQLRSQKGALPLYDTAEAIVTLKRRDPAGALALAQKAAAADPKSSAAQFVLAGIYFTQTNQVAGEAALAKAAELSPARSTRQMQYVNFLIQRGATNEARAQLDKVIKAAPDFVPGRLRKAQWSFAERNYDAVSAELNAVLTRDPSSVDARLLEAQLYLAKREPAKAQEIMEQLIKQFPDAAQLQYQAGLASLANQNANQAQLRLDRAYELNPNVVETVLLRGRLYLARGQAGEVISSTQRLLATNATVRPAYQLLGEALVANGEHDRALVVFRDYERRFTNDPAGPQAVGTLLLRKKDVAGARAAFERAYTLRPDYLPAVEQLVRLDIAENKVGVATARAQKFVEQHPEVAEARVLLAQAQLAAKQPQLAEQELEKAIDANPNLQTAYLLLAQIYNESNRRDDALKRLNALLQKQPGDQKALMLLGILYTETGDVKQAAESYETLLKKNDSFSPALNNLAYLYSEKLNNLDRAYELSRRSRQLLPDDPRIADTLGWILYLRRDYAQALVHLEEGAAKLARNGEVQYHLGMAHYAMAHEAPAKAAFQLALNLEPKAAWNKEIQDRMVVLEANGSGGDPATLKQLEQLASSRKDDVLLLSRLAQAQENAGQLDKALATFKQAAAASPAAVMPLIGLARVMAAKGDPAAALSLARKARDMSKNDPAALYELGRVAYVARDHTWSYALLQDAVAGMSGNPEVQFAFAQTAIAVGRLDSAKAALEKVSGTATAARSALQLSLLPACAAGPLAAIPADAAQRIASAQPGELLADYLKARQLAIEGRPDDAAKALASLLGSYQQFTPAKRSLAAILSARPGAAAQAEKWAREVREAQPNDAEMARVLGITALARKDYRYAADMLQEAGRALTTDGELFLLLGQARAQNKQVAEARQALNKALTLPLNDAQKKQTQELLQQLK